LEKTGASPATIVRYLALLSHLFTIAIRDWEWVSTNPVKLVTKPKEPKGRERYLSQEEIQQLLEACKQSRNRVLYTIVFCAISTGARLGELLSLSCQDMDLQRCVVIFRNTKNSDTRCVPLTTAAVAVVQDYERTIGFAGEYVFPQKSIRKAWRTAVTRAGLGRDVVFHTTRHTCGSHLAMSGASLLDIATVLGHHSMSMVRRYSHLSQGHLAEVVEKMTQRLF
jgi:integrase